MTGRYLMGAVAAAAMATPAFAGELTLFNPTVTGRQVFVAGGGVFGSTEAGRFTWNLGSEDGEEVFTFCAELTQAANDPTTFTEVDVASLPTSGDGMGEFKAQLVAELYANHFVEAVTFDGETDQDLDESAAFQLAVWEIVYEGVAGPGDLGNLDLGTGELRAYSIFGEGAPAQLANVWLSELLGNYQGEWLSMLQGLANPDFQDQILAMAMVPLPAPALLGGLGLLGLAFGRRRLAAAAGAGPGS